MTSRRQFVQGAAGLILPIYAAGNGRSDYSPSSAAPIVLRGVGQNMRATIQAFTGGLNWSNCTRSRHYSNTSFRYAKLVIPTFYQTGANHIDTLFTTSFIFQVGVEYPFNNSFTGIPDRIVVRFSGANTAHYTAGTGPGYIVSDLIDFGSNVTAGSFFGLWTTIENAAGTHSTPNSIPIQTAGENNYQAGWQRYQGYTLAASSLIAAGTALTASSCASYSASNTGQPVYTPIMALIQVPANSAKRFIFGIGDSIMYGVGESASGSGAYGDIMGSALGNAGWCARWIYEVLGHDFVNLGRGGDHFAYYSATNWQYRLALLGLANPTHIFSENGVNDVAAGEAPSAILAYAQRAYSGMIAEANVPVIQTTATISTISGDAWRTIANQTVVNSFFGNSYTHRGVWNDTHVRPYGSTLRAAGVVDPNPAIEYRYTKPEPSLETSLWNVSGAAHYLTGDGGHPNSYGHYTIANTGPACSYHGQPVTDPFV